MRLREPGNAVYDMEYFSPDRGMDGMMKKLPGCNNTYVYLHERGVFEGVGIFF